MLLASTCCFWYSPLLLHSCVGWQLYQIRLITHLQIRASRLTWEVVVHSRRALKLSIFTVLFYSKTLLWDLYILFRFCIKGLYMWQPILGLCWVYLKTSAYLSILFLFYKFCIVGFLGVRLTCPVGFGHVPSHLVLRCVKWYQSPGSKVSHVQTKS